LDIKVYDENARAIVYVKSWERIRNGAFNRWSRFEQLNIVHRSGKFPAFFVLIKRGTLLLSLLNLEKQGERIPRTFHWHLNCSNLRTDVFEAKSSFLRFYPCDSIIFWLPRIERRFDVFCRRIERTKVQPCCVPDRYAAVHAGGAVPSRVYSQRG